MATGKNLTFAGAKTCGSHLTLLLVDSMASGGPGGRPPLSEETRAARVELGRRLRKARENATLTRHELALATEHKARRIAEWEAGERPLPAESLLILARACGVTGAHILGEQRTILTTPA